MPKFVNHACGPIGFSILAVLLFVFGLVYGGAISLSDQASLFDGLRNTAAIVFGVMGAWIAIVYPQALSAILDPTREDEEEEVRTVKRLLLPMLVSTLILAALLIGAPIFAVVKESGFAKKFPARLNAASFSVLLVLTATQCWALIYSLVPLGLADSEIVSRAENKAARRRHTANAQRQPPDTTSPSED